MLFLHSDESENSTAIPYRASTGPEQGFPCVLFPVGKSSTQEKPCFYYRDGFAVWFLLKIRNQDQKVSNPFLEPLLFWQTFEASSKSVHTIFTCTILTRTLI